MILAGMIRVYDAYSKIHTHSLTAGLFV